VPGLAEGSWELVRGHPQARDTLARVAAFEIRAGRTTFLDAASAPEGRMVGRVTRGGVPVAGAFVMAQVSRPRVRTDAEGRFAVPATDATPGEAYFDVRPPEPEAVPAWFALGARARPTGGGSGGGSGGGRGGAGAKAAAAPSREPTPPTVRLEDDGYELELPTGGLRVRATRSDGSPAAGVELRLHGNRVSAVRTTGADGVARWLGLGPGAYDVRATFPWTGARARAEVVVDEVTEEAELREPTSGELRVVVRDSAGRPAAGARVTASVLVGLEPGAEPSPERWRTAVALDDPPAIAGADGVAVLRGVPHGYVGVGAASYEGGRVGWGASPKERGGAQLEFAGAARATVEIRLEPPPPMKGFGGAGLR
jgi:hypothetical protein